MTPKDEYDEKECKCFNSLEEICENTRAIRRVVNRIFDHMHESDEKDEDEQLEEYDPDEIDWENLDSNDDMFS